MKLQPTAATWDSNVNILAREPLPMAATGDSIMNILARRPLPTAATDRAGKGSQPCSQCPIPTSQQSVRSSFAATDGRATDERTTAKDKRGTNGRAVTAKQTAGLTTVKVARRGSAEPGRDSWCQKNFGAAFFRQNYVKNCCKQPRVIITLGALSLDHHHIRPPHRPIHACPKIPTLQATAQNFYPMMI